VGLRGGGGDPTERTILWKGRPKKKWSDLGSKEGHGNMWNDPVRKKLGAWKISEGEDAMRGSLFTTREKEIKDAFSMEHPRSRSGDGGGQKKSRENKRKTKTFGNFIREITSEGENRRILEVLLLRLKVRASNAKKWVELGKELWNEKKENSEGSRCWKEILKRGHLRLSTVDRCSHPSTKGGHRRRRHLETNSGGQM